MVFDQTLDKLQQDIKKTNKEINRLRKTIARQTVFSIGFLTSFIVTLSILVYVY